MSSDAKCSDDSPFIDRSAPTAPDPFQRRLSEVIQALSREHSLSSRETEILWAAARGRSTKEVAAALRISRKTVEFFWGRLYQKLNCHSQLEAAAIVLERALRA